MSTPNPPSYTIDDYRYAYYNKALGGSGGITPPSGGSGSGSSGIVANSSQVANQWQTQANEGTVTAPAAFATLAFVTVATAGFYKVTVSYGYGATGESTTPDNFQLAVNSNLISGLPAAAGSSGVNNLAFTPQTFYLKCNANDNIRLNAGGTAGSAGSIYKGFLTVDRLQ